MAEWVRGTKDKNMGKTFSKAGISTPFHTVGLRSCPFSFLTQVRLLLVDSIHAGQISAQNNENPGSENIYNSQLLPWAPFWADVKEKSHSSLVYMTHTDGPTQLDQSCTLNKDKSQFRLHLPLLFTQHLLHVVEG